MAEYLSEVTGSNKASDSFLAQIERSIDVISEFPTMYAISRMPELAAKGYRVAYVGNYAMLYAFEEETIFIAHIFHQRQDYASLV